jgi:LPS-assembly protein
MAQWWSIRHPASDGRSHDHPGFAGGIDCHGPRRLTDPTDLATERLELNVNTEAGVVTHGRMYLRSTNSLVEGRLLQRFSEDHYRVKEGRFTNCDAQKGETPAWRFEFKDLTCMPVTTWNLRGWFCVNDVPVIPILMLTIRLHRHSGFLIPNVGFDNRFGTHLQESYYYQS